ncbi:GntR family transcriptional regulator [Roseibium denhamense]|uniref:GntR family transcriptional regulator n=1 Tax=Roseibium denhamense TaxID=76305 RepID=UPI0024B7FA77|nr:FCD domain-containing protein [Roseibium denhamense]
MTSVSKSDLIEIGGLRVLLEYHALRLSVENGDTDWEGNLVAAHHKLHLMEQKMFRGDESEKETWKRYDWEFHLAMIEACSNKNLLSLHSIMYDRYLRYQMLVLTYRGEDAVREQKEMFEVALARDTKTATKSLEQHIKNGVEHALAAMA